MQEKLLIEESKQQFTLTQEEIQSYFKSVLKQDYSKAIELFIRYVKVYENKIEIGICNIVNQKQNDEQIFKKVFTETLTTQRTFKGGTTKINSKTYDVYLII